MIYQNEGFIFEPPLEVQSTQKAEEANQCVMILGLVWL